MCKVNINLQDFKLPILETTESIKYSSRVPLNHLLASFMPPVEKWDFSNYLSLLCFNVLS